MEFRVGECRSGANLWGQPPKRVPKTPCYSDILRNYRLNGKKLRIQCGTFSVLSCFAQKRFDILARSAEIDHIKRVSCVGLKNDALVTRQGKSHITSFSLSHFLISHISYLISHHPSPISHLFIAVQQLHIRLTERV